MANEKKPDNDKEKDKDKANIIVNAKKVMWPDNTISFSQLIDLAYAPPHKDTEFFTVQFNHGPKENRDGTLVEGQAVFVKSGMTFDVTRTDKS